MLKQVVHTVTVLIERYTCRYTDPVVQFHARRTLQRLLSVGCNKYRPIRYLQCSSVINGTSQTNAISFMYGVMMLLITCSQETGVYGRRPVRPVPAKWTAFLPIIRDAPN
jgi:hypothetical protein